MFLPRRASIPVAFFIVGYLTIVAWAQLAPQIIAPPSNNEESADDVHATWQPRKPATQPVVEAKLERWFNELGASDAAVRDGALGELLQLTRAELPGLRRVVERAGPVAPSQAHALRDAVNHVFLSGEVYPAEPRVGFLGLGIPTLDSVEIARAGEPPHAPDAPGPARASTGVPVQYRIPGFCAFSALRDGDVVVAILKPIPRRLRDWIELTYSIRAFPAGQTLTLQVLRHGIIMNVPVTLDATRLVPNQDVWHDVILPKREAAADAYWKEHFAPLVDEPVKEVSMAQPR